MMCRVTYEIATMKWRGIFRIHLTTAIALMMVASGLVWLNLHPLRAGVHSELFLWEDGTWGWPLLFKKSIIASLATVEEWTRQDLLFDLCIALAILATVAYCSELRIRRREALKKL